MKNKQTGHKNRCRLFWYFVPMMIAAIVMQLLFSGHSTEKTVTIEGFAYDPCGGCFADGIPCKPCTVMLGLEQYLAAELKTLELEVGFQVHNLFYAEEQQKLQALLPGKYIQDMEYPVLIVGDTVLYGWEQVKQSFRRLVLAETGYTQAEIALLTQATDTEIQLERADSETLVYFKMETCRACKEALVYLQGVMRDNPTLELLVYDIEEDGMMDLFEAYCHIYEIDSSEATVPILFIGDKYLDGETEIQLFLSPYLDKGFAHTTYRVLP